MKWHRRFIFLIEQYFTEKMWMDLAEELLKSKSEDLHSWAILILLYGHGLKFEFVF